MSFIILLVASVCFSVNQTEAQTPPPLPDPSTQEIPHKPPDIPLGDCFRYRTPGGFPLSPRDIGQGIVRFEYVYNPAALCWPEIAFPSGFFRKRERADRETKR